MARTICRVFGAAFLLAGIAGFFMPRLLGFHLTPIHNVIHIASGLAALYFGFVAGPGGVAGFCKAFGAVYLLIGVLGFVAPALLAAILGHHGDVTAGELLPDNLFHVVVGGAFLLAGLTRPAVPAVAPR
jgi:hypothetical protein